MESLMRYSILSVLIFVLTLHGWNVTAASLPDLIIGASGINPFVTTQTFTPDDCIVVEGCVEAGTRRLLKFGTLSVNIGSGDVNLGNPVGNPLFHFHICHGHYHFEQFAVYRLLNSAGQLVAAGTKAGFCIEDDYPFLEGASRSATYDCDNQGLQPGWADYYSPETPCQWIDVTGVPAGLYTLELEIDPEHLIAESNESNNFTRIAVAVDGDCASVPANDNFSAAQVISGLSAIVLGGNGCATKEPGEPSHAGNAGGHSLWYRWTAPVSGPAVISTEGSTFDTLLAVYHGSVLTNLSVDASRDDLYRNSSVVAFDATVGGEYYIVVDGYQGATGGLLLQLNPDQLTPPHIDAITCVPAGEVRLTISGSPSAQYEIQFTTTLGAGAWERLGQVTNFTGTVQFSDLSAKNGSQRFYRAVLAPIAEPPAVRRVTLVGTSEQAWQASDVWMPGTLSRTVAASKFLVTLGCWWDERYTTTSLPTDSNGTFLSALGSGSLSDAPVQVQVGYQLTPAIGSHVITPPAIGGSGDGFFLLLEAEGVSATSSVRDSGRARISHPFHGPGDPDTIQSITVMTDGTAAQIGDPAVAIIVMDNNSNPDINISLPAGWTSLGFNDAAVDNVGYRACYKIVTTPGKQTATCNWTDGSTFVADAGIVVFKAAVATP